MRESMAEFFTLNYLQTIVFQKKKKKVSCWTASGFKNVVKERKEKKRNK